MKTFTARFVLLAIATILLSATNPAFAQSWAYHLVEPERDQPTNSSDLVWVLGSVACSSDGAKIVAAASGSSISEFLYSGGLVCLSTDMGADWQAAPLPTNTWSDVASSADGTKLAVVAATGSTNAGDYTFYTSADSGTNWTPHGAQPYTGDGFYTGWNCVASSADGTKLAASMVEYEYIEDYGNSNLYTGMALSTDSGLTWQPSGLTGEWNKIVSSSDGNTLAALGSPNNKTPQTVYVSTDSGGSWQPANLPTGLVTFIALSGDGKTLVATGTNVFVSRNSGASWTEWTNAPQGPYGPIYWTAPAVSADGTKMMVGAYGDGSPGTIYTSDNAGVTWASTNNAFAGSASFLTASASSADGRALIALPRGGNYVFTLDLPQPGHVYCVCDSNAIAGATVQIGTNKVTCDNNGAYSFTNLASGTYLATVSATNYETFTTNLTLSPNQPVTNNFYLTNTIFVIAPVFDSSLTSLTNFMDISNSIVQSLQIYNQTLADPLCVRIQFLDIADGLGQSLTPRGAISYSQYWADLEANTNMSANDITALATLHAPPSTGINSISQVRLTAANLDAIGEHALASALVTENSGLNSQIWFNMAIMNVTRPPQVATNYDLPSTVQHEVDEVLGIGGAGSALRLATVYSGQPGPTNGVGSMDLYRYASPGFRSFSYSTNIAPYFSITGGASSLVYFNQAGNSSDYADWGDGVIPPDQKGNSPPQVQDAFGAPSAAPDMGANEFIALDVVGYTLQSTTSIQGLMFSGNTFTLTVATLPGQTCQVQFTTDLNSTAWQNLNGPFVATGMTQTITDTTASGKARYYRVVVLPSATPKPALVKVRPQPIDPSKTPFSVDLELNHFLPRNSNNRQ